MDATKIGMDWLAFRGDIRGAEARGEITKDVAAAKLAELDAELAAAGVGFAPVIDRKLGIEVGVRFFPLETK